MSTKQLAILTAPMSRGYLTQANASVMKLSLTIVTAYPCLSDTNTLIFVAATTLLTYSIISCSRTFTVFCFCPWRSLLHHPLSYCTNFSWGVATCLRIVLFFLLLDVADLALRDSFFFCSASFFLFSSSIIR